MIAYKRIGAITPHVLSGTIIPIIDELKKS